MNYQKIDCELSELCHKYFKFYCQVILFVSTPRSLKAAIYLSRWSYTYALTKAISNNGAIDLIDLCQEKAEVKYHVS